MNQILKLVFLKKTPISLSIRSYQTLIPLIQLKDKNKYKIKSQLTKCLC